MQSNHIMKEQDANAIADALLDADEADHTRPAYFDKLSPDVQKAYDGFTRENNIPQAFSVMRTWSLYGGSKTYMDLFEALMIVGTDADAVRRAVCAAKTSYDLLIQLLDLIYQPRIAIGKGSVHGLAGKLVTVKQFWERCGATMILPDKKFITREFIRQCMGDQKMLLPKNSRIVHMPKIPELSAEALDYWAYYPRIAICLPDPVDNKKKIVDRNYLAAVINTVYPGAMEQLLNEIIKNRTPLPEPEEHGHQMPALIAEAIAALPKIPEGIRSSFAKKGPGQDRPVKPYLAFCVARGVTFAVSNLPDYFGAVDPKLIPAVQAKLALLNR